MSSTVWSRNARKMTTGRAWATGCGVGSGSVRPGGRNGNMHAFGAECLLDSRYHSRRACAVTHRNDRANFSDADFSSRFVGLRAGDGFSNDGNCPAFTRTRPHFCLATYELVQYMFETHARCRHNREKFCRRGPSKPHQSCRRKPSKPHQNCRRMPSKPHENCRRKPSKPHDDCPGPEKEKHLNVVAEANDVQPRFCFIAF